MTIISAQNNVKYFPEESLAFWDKKRCFSGIWEQVETGKYLPVVVIDGEILGTDGDQEEIARAMQKSQCYLIAGCPRAIHIGSRGTERSTFLYWRDSAGNYYQEILGVMEVERWYQGVLAREKKNRKKRKK